MADTNDKTIVPDMLKKTVPSDQSPESRKAYEWFVNLRDWHLEELSELQDAPQDEKSLRQAEKSRTQLRLSEKMIRLGDQGVCLDGVAKGLYAPNLQVYRQQFGEKADLEDFKNHQGYLREEEREIRSAIRVLVEKLDYACPGFMETDSMNDFINDFRKQLLYLDENLDSYLEARLFDICCIENDPENAETNSPDPFRYLPRDMKKNLRVSTPKVNKINHCNFHHPDRCMPPDEIRRYIKQGKPPTSSTHSFWVAPMAAVVEAIKDSDFTDSDACTITAELFRLVHPETFQGELDGEQVKKSYQAFIEEKSNPPA